MYRGGDVRVENVPDAQRDVLSHALQRSAIVLRMMKNCRLFPNTAERMRDTLNRTMEMFLAKLSVRFLNDFPGARNVQTNRQPSSASPSGSSASRLQLDHVMWRGFALAGGTDTNVTRLLLQLGQVRRAEITHAGLNAANELRQHAVG